MYVELVPNSTKLCWFVPIDYTDPETPLPRRFMVEFMNDAEREKFRDEFMRCSKEMQGHVVNHKLVSLLAAGSPRKESPSGKTPKSVSFQQSPEIFEFEGVTPEPNLEEIQETPKKDPPETRPHNICANLKQEFEELSHEIVDEKKEAAPLTPEDTSLEIIKEVLPSADKQVKESELSLPKGFYNYEDKESCSGCVGCDDDSVTEGAPNSSVSDSNAATDSVAQKTPSPPALYDVIPALDPSSQAHPFGLNTSGNSFAAVSQGSNLFGISPSSSPFTPSNTNFFLQNQKTTENIFLQGNTNISTENPFLRSQNTDNIFLKSGPTEEKKDLESSDQNTATPQQTGKPSFNPFASPPMPSLSPGPAVYNTGTDEDYDDEYEYDGNYEDYENEYDNYDEIQEED